MLSIAFLPRSKCLNFKAAVTICSDFGAQENKVCDCFHCFPIYLPRSDGPRYPDLCLLKLSFKPTLSFSSFIKRLSSLLSALHIWAYWYLSQQSSVQLVRHPAQHFTWCTLQFSCSHVWMRQLDYIKSWAPKNWCFWTVVLEKTLESPLENKEIQPVHPKGDQSWVFTGRTDVEAETPILWPPDVKSWLIWKDPDAGKDRGQEEKWRQRMRWLDTITNSMVWVWVNSGSWWWTGRPGVLRFMGSQRDTTKRLNWTLHIR